MTYLVVYLVLAYLALIVVGLVAIGRAYENGFMDGYHKARAVDGTDSPPPR